MKGLAILIPALIVLGFSDLAWADHEKNEPSDGTVASFIPVDPPQALSPLSFEDANGKSRHLGEFRGRVTLVNLWASWCPPCLRELPALDRLQKTFGEGEFKIVALSIDRGGRPTAERTFRRLGIEDLALFVVPPDVVAKTFPADVLPANFIINRHGELTNYLRSFVDWDNQEAMAFVFNLITAPD